MPSRSQSAVRCTRLVRSAWSIPLSASRRLDAAPGCVGASSRAVLRIAALQLLKIVRHLLAVVSEALPLLLRGGNLRGAGLAAGPAFRLHRFARGGQLAYTVRLSRLLLR